jgi:hypothetical protein
MRPASARASCSGTPMHLARSEIDKEEFEERRRLLGI